MRGCVVVESRKVGVLGASSMIGKILMPMMEAAELEVIAYARNALPQQERVETRILQPVSEEGEQESIQNWISLMPVWALPEHFDRLKAHHARRIVTLSSTSVFSKRASSSDEEKALALKLATAERQLIEWAEENGIEWIILRPTLIYGLGADMNISVIARFISRFGFFPLFGKASGLRQPVHLEDVAGACLSALLDGHVRNRSYQISGGETLSYREMVARIFTAMGRKPRYLHVPLWLFRLAVSFIRKLPRYRNWSVAMVERMNSDLVFDHADATKDFGFDPRGFVLQSADLPR
jgi:nucleoside-diphosphate-sugar epimerase